MKIPFIDQDGFKDAISSNKIVVVKFGAPWCGPCKMMAPMLEKVADDFPDINFFEVNVDADPNLSAQFNIRSLPTLMAWRDGVVLWSNIGVPSMSDLKKELSKI